jgi:hypothetical protein
LALKFEIWHASEHTYLHTFAADKATRSTRQRCCMELQDISVFVRWSYARACIMREPAGAHYLDASEDKSGTLISVPAPMMPLLRLTRLLTLTLADCPSSFGRCCWCCSVLLVLLSAVDADWVYPQLGSWCCSVLLGVVGAAVPH